MFKLGSFKTSCCVSRSFPASVSKWTLQLRFCTEFSFEKKALSLEWPYTKPGILMTNLACCQRLISPAKRQKSLIVDRFPPTNRFSDSTVDVLTHNSVCVCVRQILTKKILFWNVHLLECDTTESSQKYFGCALSANEFRVTFSILFPQRIK